MRKIDKFQSVFAVAFLLMAFAGGCGVNNEQMAQESARQFVLAMESGSSDAARETMTATAKRKMADYPQFWGDRHPVASHTIGRPAIEGEFATVPLTLQEGDESQNAEVKLRLEEGKWRVHALVLNATKDSPARTMDFENPDTELSQAFHDAGKAVGVAAKEFTHGMTTFLKGMTEGLSTAQKGVRAADQKMAEVEKTGRDLGAAMAKTQQEIAKTQREVEQRSKEAEAKIDRAAKEFEENRPIQRERQQREERQLNHRERKGQHRPGRINCPVFFCRRREEKPNQAERA